MDKKAYFVNYGKSKEVERITSRALDEEWSRTGYVMIVLNQNEPPAPLPERKYAVGSVVIATGTVLAAPETEGHYLFLQEDDFSNGIYLRSTPALQAILGRHLKLSGRAVEENATLKDGDKKLIVLDNPAEQK